MTDILIVGAGIVGLATGLKLKEKYPDQNIVILEKEAGLASHQTGHNSGVIHSGLYYKPGSLKAINCVNGYNQIIEFCQRNSIKHDICGKVVVASNETELPYLKVLQERGQQNGLEGIIYLNSEQLKQYEPHVVGLAGLFVPQTGIVNYLTVAEKMGELFKKAGGIIRLNQQAIGIHTNRHGVFTESTNSSIHSKYLINCAGLYSDQIANLSNTSRDIRIIPFRGEYYKLKPDKDYLVNNLIYPVPNPDFPFLGVHFTRMINGGIEAGPNAVLAFAREGYRKSEIFLPELLDSIFWPGFIKVAQKYWKTGMSEMYRSFFKAAFTKSLQKLIPEVKESDLMPGGAGVRAQACDRNGGLLDDFMIQQSDCVMNVYNAPSPAATSSLSIADEIINRTSLWVN